ncbi:hypothetical protein [Novosphingobium sp. 9U]|uniref:hypothetical protein n=1 Tax=Novosphingobium sp. 9U TaxID=2653158 RepID=UPI00135B55C1|nr:hypothetical protein [Novosphingobium sp. 9U]
MNDVEQSLNEDDQAEAELAQQPQPALSSDTTAPTTQEKAATAEKIPYEIGGSLGLLVMVPLVPESENAAVQLHTNFFYCGGDIKLSYSLQPVPTRNLHEVQFRGMITAPDGSRVPFDFGSARHVEGHHLGCGSQARTVDHISRFGDVAKYSAMLDGLRGSEVNYIKTFLGKFFVSPYPAPWPPGTIGAPMQKP